MKKLLIISLFISSLYAQECVLFLSQSPKVAKKFAKIFQAHQLKTFYISHLGKNHTLHDDNHLASLVKKSNCDYGIIDPVTLSSTNINNKATFTVSLKLYKKSVGKFKTITWEKKLQTDIIDLKAKGAKDKVLTRFINLSAEAALDYYKK